MNKTIKETLKGERRRIIEQIREEEKQKLKTEIIKQINKADRAEVDWEDMYAELKDFINNL